MSTYRIHKPFSVQWMIIFIYFPLFFFFHSQNNLNYAICIQRQWDYCTVTYGNEEDNVEYDFQMLNVDSGEILNWT